MISVKDEIRFAPIRTIKDQKINMYDLFGVGTIESIRNKMRREVARMVRLTNMTLLDLREEYGIEV